MTQPSSSRCKSADIGIPPRFTPCTPPKQPNPYSGFQQQFHGA